MTIRYLYLLVIAFLINGCSSTAGKITDTETKPVIDMIENLDPDMITMTYSLDNMDRGNHDYYNQPLVIQQSFDLASLKRGTVILFKDNNNNEQISRIVGLPSEKIQIKKGEIFIDSQFLDTFYGKAHRAGLEMKEYMKAMEEEDAEYHADSVKEIFEMDLEEIKLKSDEYFLISDDWLRGAMVRIDENQITGIILGYEK